MTDRTDVMYAGIDYSPVDPRDGRDVTAELTAWLQALPNGAVADLRGRTYRCETFIKLTDKTDLTIQNGTLVRTVVGAIAWPNPNPHLWLLRPTRVTVDNLTVTGTNTAADQKPDFGSYLSAYEFEAAIRLERFTDCKVTNLHADAVWGDGVQWQTGSGAYMADSVIDRNGRQGVTVIASDVLIERVRVEHSRRSGFDIEPDTATQGVHHIEIRDCYTNSIGLPFASAGRGPVNDVHIHHNTSTGTSVPVLYVKASDGARRANWRFEDHTAVKALGSPQPAAFFVNVDGFTVERCTIPIVPNQSKLAVGAIGCGGECVVTGNNFDSGRLYYNRAPLAGQSLQVSDNTPALAETP